MHAMATGKSIREKFSNSEAAQALNRVIRVDNERDQEAVLEMLGDYFGLPEDSDDEQLDGITDEFQDLERPPAVQMENQGA